MDADDAVSDPARARCRDVGCVVTDGTGSGDASPLAGVSGAGRGLTGLASHRSLSTPELGHVDGGALQEAVTRGARVVRRVGELRIEGKISSCLTLSGSSDAPP